MSPDLVVVQVQVHHCWGVDEDVAVEGADLVVAEVYTAQTAHIHVCILRMLRRLHTFMYV